MTTEEIAKLKGELLNLNKEIGTLSQGREALCLTIAVATCPYRVGEQYIAKSIGYRGRMCEITKVAASGYQGKWRVRALILNGNGKPGQREVSWDSDDER